MGWGTYSRITDGAYAAWNAGKTLFGQNGPDASSDSRVFRWMLAGAGLVVGGGLYALFIQRWSGRGGNTGSSENQGFNGGEIGPGPNNDENYNGQGDVENEVVPINGDIPGPSDEDDPEQPEDPEDLQEIFLGEIIPHFTSIQAFLRFAHSKRGLRLDRTDTSDIMYSHEGDAHSQKLAMLKLWKQKKQGEATVECIRNIVHNYCINREPEDVPDRLQDVFQNEIVPAFASLDQFKKFATSAKGLGLEMAKVDDIWLDVHDANEKKMTALDQWREDNLYCVTLDDSIARILEIKNSYLAQS